MKILKLFCYIIVIAVLTTCNKEEKDDINEIYTTKIENITFQGISINSIEVENNGIIWFGTNNGLYSYNMTDWKKYSGDLLSNQINCVKIKSNQIYLGTDKGVIILKKEDENLVLEKNYTINNSDLLSDTVNAIAFDRFDDPWFGTYNGLCYINNDEWIDSVDRYIKNYNISSIAFIGNDYYFGTYGKCLYHGYYNPDIDAISTSSQMYPSFNGKLTTDTIYDVYKGNDDYLWFGSTKGLTKNKGNPHVSIGEFEYFLEGENITCVCQFNNGAIWAGSKNGLWKQEGENWINVNKNNGLSDNTINCITEDGNGKVWLGTNNGISMFDGNNWVTY